VAVGVAVLLVVLARRPPAGAAEGDAADRSIQGRSNPS
jgi:hypothetical protein